MCYPCSNCDKCGKVTQIREKMRLWREEKGLCPICGYPLDKESIFCELCGYEKYESLSAAHDTAANFEQIVWPENKE